MNLAKCYDGIGRTASPLVALSAGSLQLLFDPITGWIREIKLEEAEIVQAIYPAVRGENWATIPYKINKLRFEEEDGNFRVLYEAQTREAKHPFQFRVEIQGAKATGLKVHFSGKATSSFATNRVGLCVLHPSKLCAGKEYQVTGPGGNKVEGSFPKAISPNVVQSGIQALKHEAAPGVPVLIQFEGDVFEMEDQRNYSDDSFKTYSTQKNAKQPWTLEPDLELSQSVQVQVPSGSASRGGSEVPYVDVSFGAKSSHTLPALGVCAAGHGERLSDEAIQRLKNAQLDHVRIDLKLGQVPVMAALSLGARQAADLGAKLLIGLHLNEDAAQELHGLRSLLDQIKPEVAAWLVFPPGGKYSGGRWIDLARNELGKYAPDAPFLIGSPGGFLGLNRLGTDTEMGDGLVFGASPTVHDESNLTILTNLGGLGEVAVSGRQLAGQRPLYLSPLHLRATGSQSLENESLGIPGDVDLRQGSLLAASWIVGVMQHVARGPVHAVTLFETTGWRGLMERQKGSPMPTRFGSKPGMVFPVYHLAADLGESKGHKLLNTDIAQPGRVAAVGVAVEGGLRLWVANLTPEPVLVMVKTESEAEYSWVRTLDEVSYEKATETPAEYRSESLSLLQKREGSYPLALLPYGVARLDEAEAEVTEE